MRIGLQTWGSEGDIRPFAALASGLVQAGHDVTLVATDVAERDYSKLAVRHGFQLRMVATPVIRSPEEMAALGAILLAVAHPALQAKFIFSRALAPAMTAIADAALTLAAESDMVIGHFVLHPLRVAAEKHSIPYVTVHLVHGTIPTTFHSPLGFPDISPTFRRIGWTLARWACNRMVLKETNTFRKHHGRMLLRDVMTESWTSQTLNLVCVSPAIFDHPADWGATHSVCGFLDFPRGGIIEPLPEGLEAFFDRGEPPVFFGFGSLVPTHLPLLKRTVQLWSKAADVARVRAVIQLPDEFVERFENSDSIQFIGRAPHQLVFPRCAAIVHHGGSGTTQASLLAGRPSVVIAHVADQFLWGSELVRLGASPRRFNRISVRARPLGLAIARAVNEPQFLRAAESISRQMQSENGVAHAVARIETLAQPEICA